MSQIRLERDPSATDDDVYKALAKIYKMARYRANPGLLEKEQEYERSVQEFERNQRKMKQAEDFVRRQHNRMKAVPEPIFVLGLPDDLIGRLVAAGFDTVGKVLFGLHVDWETSRDGYGSHKEVDIVLLSRKQLLKASGETGYMLIGSRLLANNYIQRMEFINHFREHSTQILPDSKG